MNDKAFLTVCTADYYQYYIPIYIWSIKKTWPDVDILIYVRGEMNNDVKDALKLINQEGVYVYENYKTNYPYLDGTTNALRFTVNPVRCYRQIIITDIDFFFSVVSIDLFRWHNQQLELMKNECYVGHHGPYSRPHRPAICESWTRDFERIAGGFVVLFPEWFIRTKKQVAWYDSLLLTGKWGHFRESDEVMLFRIVRDSGLPIAPKVPFPRVLRHIHFGDFKNGMEVRYRSKKRMKSILDKSCAKNFSNSLNDKEFSKIIDIVKRDINIDTIICRCIEYCQDRN